jgi:hypothetical protein
LNPGITCDAKISSDAQMCSWRLPPLCWTNLVDPGLLVAAQMLAQLRGRADAAAPGILRELVPDL